MNHVLKDTFGNRNPAILKLNKSALQLGYNYWNKGEGSMPVKQISVSLENVPGKLSEVSDYLGENGINIIA